VHPELMRLHLGTGLEVLNAYPLFHTRAFFEGMQKAGETEAMFLCRSAWPAASANGCLLWSGDIRFQLRGLRDQIRGGLNAGLSGIGWWTTTSAVSTTATAPSLSSASCWCAGSSGRCSARCSACTASASRTMLPNSNARRKKPYGKDSVLVFTDTGGDNEVWSWGEEILPDPHELHVHARAPAPLRDAADGDLQQDRRAAAAPACSSNSG